MPKADSPFGYIFVVIEIDLFRLERTDESLSISVLPRPSATGAGNLNAMFFERGNIGQG
jgi:hypothetical protein